ncbi:ABC transporter ATP-binding protein [Methylopila jiangsuensis]|uniref:ABC transporter ATP-binding protein n=1 Tax=Methylopila jiangsuensis TaxID=586230 RepID=A0A9W6N2J6_9HYPH|nr:ABC transporter ATP-binding protein [Methylopila jiangsuensis]MDR6285596.1 branched-chain amino acid transport system ATP-binding protein [Methylopila jiangsuensis]GLK75355.1 ABC transporter ATP-binding protein [Methylopila jiangsuensis]
MLKVEDLHAYYGKSHVLRGVNLHVKPGEAVGLLGRNGVGKTTTMKAIMRLMPSASGHVTFDGAPLDGVDPFRVAPLGLGIVPQGRRLFPKLTVYENLCLGLAKDPPAEGLSDIFARFPRLKERLTQLAGTLSGGEQQQLAIARCLVMNPKMILFDEPTEGIMPKLVAQIRRQIREINKTGISVLLVEQNIKTAIEICDRIYIMEKGEICFEGPAEALKNDQNIVHRYLGVALR